MLVQYGIQHQGGPIMGTAPLGSVVNVYLIWYGSGWATAGKASIRSFMQNVGGSDWWGTMGSYMDTAGRYINVDRGSVVLAGEVSITTGKTSLSDNDVWSKVSTSISSGALPNDVNGVYFVLSDASTNQVSDPTQAFCKA